MRPSSTSNSESLTWLTPAARILIGIALGFLLLDRLVGVFTPWEWLSARVPRAELIPAGVIRDEVALRRSRPGNTIVIGASRVQPAFYPKNSQIIKKSKTRFTVLAHPGLGAYSMQALAPRIVDAEPGLVIFGLSELDTHSALRLEPCVAGEPSHAFASVLFSSPLHFLAEQRNALLRLGLAAGVHTYRHRLITERLLFSRGLRFKRDQRLRPRAYLRQLRASDRGELRGPHYEVAAADLHEIVQDLTERFPGRYRLTNRPYFRLVRNLSDGDNAVIKTALVRAAIQHVAESDVPVAIVELPIYALGRRLYDPRLRREFHRVVGSMVDQYGLRFVPLEEQPTYEDGDFIDMTHTNHKGGLKLLRVFIDVATRTN